MRRLLSLFAVLFMIQSLAAQEVLRPLNSNPLLQNASDKNIVNAKEGNLELPFSDDFNQKGYYPDLAKWEDKFVFVNNNFPILPPTLGVATFDGLDENGKPYSDDPKSFGAADRLTSRPVDLSEYTASDNIYLSFYWQAGGLGEVPERNVDYMTVNFLDKDGNWNEILNINPPQQSEDFRQEFIRITEDYLHEGFQFNFTAYGNLAGSSDHWHIDYVLLDKNRNPDFESSVSDVAYVKGNGKFFKNYYQMPFYHFKQEMLTDTFSARVKNNFLNTVDIVDNYSVINLTDSSEIDSYKGPSTDIFSLEDVDYEYPVFDLSSLVPRQDTTIIEIKYFFQSSAENASPDFVRANNELREYITFGNTFAYDDGTAERAYRLINYDFGKIAVKFELDQPDTLRAVKIYFSDFPNRTASSKDPYFNLAVYQALDTVTGEYDEIIYRETLLQRSDFYVPENEVFNGFAYYKFKPELNEGKDFIPVSGDFYIAIEHEKFNDVDVGFDLNHSGQAYMFYNVGEGWHQTQYPGSLMINAVVGAEINDFPTSVNERVLPVLHTYPNPATDYVRLRTENISEVKYFEIYDISGAKIISSHTLQNEFISIESLKPGWYLLMLKDENYRPVGMGNFIKQ